MTDIKFIACDLDGTLLTDNKDILVSTYNSLMEAQKRGIRLILASGRNSAMIAPYAEKLQLDRYGGYMVGCNGHHIVDAQKGVRIENESIDVITSAKLFAFAKKHHLQFLAEHSRGFYVYVPKSLFPIKMLVGFLKQRHKLKKKHQGDYSVLGGFTMSTKSYVNSVNKPADIKEECIKIGITHFPKVIQRALVKLDEDLREKLNIMYVTSYWVDIMPKGIDKSVAIEQILSQNGVGFESLMAFGDAHNDIGMISKAGIGIAMGNAMETIKQNADQITKSNEENGIGLVVDHLLKVIV
jgi:Cof subfamily protein (haloacid dehalogenase superfamily)